MSCACGGYSSTGTIVVTNCCGCTYIGFLFGDS
jgi:hypothetical protein